LFLGRGDGTFAELSDLSGADSPLDGRGLVAADFDDDGDQDLFVHNIQRERHGLWRNELDPPSFLKVRLSATRSQHEAIGAEVTVDGPLGPVAQVVSRGGGYASCQPPELVFGLGAASSAAVRVRWPGGEVESFGMVERGRVLLVQGEGEARGVPGRPFRLADPLPEGLDLRLGDAVPDLVVLSASGEKQRLSAVDAAGGKELLLVFWASYCAPCVREIPELERWQGTEGRTVVAISVDAPRDRESAEELLRSRGATYPGYYLAMSEEDNAGGLDELVDLLRLSIPTVIAITPDGRIASVLRGPPDGN
jgi:thiol-disulfide isomerase/thioredoxin